MIVESVDRHWYSDLGIIGDNLKHGCKEAGRDLIQNAINIYVVNIMVFI